MPTQAVAAQINAGSHLIAVEVQSPVYVSADAEAGARLEAFLGPASLLSATTLGAGALAANLGVGFPVAADLAGSGALGASGLTLPFAATAAMAGGAALEGIALARDVFLDGVLGGAGDLGATVGVSQSLTAAMAAGSALDATFDAALVWPLKPLPGQQPGTLNLARNPSLEYAAFGLTDWEAGGAGALARVAGGWDGDWSAELAAPAGALDGTATVRSQRGLALAGDDLWIGALSVRGDGGAVGLALELVYADGTVAAGAETLTTVAATGWDAAPRLATEPVRADPTRTLEEIRIVARVPADPGAARAVGLDAAQIERDTGARATPFASGDDPDGFHAWLGAPGLSPTLRRPKPAGG